MSTIFFFYIFENVSLQNRIKRRAGTRDGYTAHEKGEEKDEGKIWHEGEKDRKKEEQEGEKMREKES